MFHLAVALNVVLPTHEIPQEIAPVHEIHLIGDEEAQVFECRRPSALSSADTHPLFVCFGMPLTVHARKPHIVLVQIFNVVADNVVVRLPGVGRRPVDRFSLLMPCHHIVALWLVIQFTAIGRSIEKRGVAILFAVQIAAQRKNVAGRILAHRRLGIGSDENHPVAAVACQHQQQTGHRQFQHPPLHLIIYNNEYHRQQNDIDDEPRVVRTTQQIGKQQFRPSAQLHHTRYDAIEDNSDKQTAADQRQEQSFGRNLLRLTIIHHKRHGRQTEQAEQMDTHGKSCDIGYQHKPPVGIGSSGLTLPFQYQPKHQRRKETGKGIDFGLNGRKPEGVAESVGQCAHHAAGLNADYLCRGQRALGVAKQFAGQMRNGKEQEEDAAGTKQRRQEVNRKRHLRRIAGKLTEKVGHQHKDWCARRMPNLQFVATGNELRTVPKTGRWLHRQTIHHRCNGKE